MSSLRLRNGNEPGHGGASVGNDNFIAMRCAPEQLWQIPYLSNINAWQITA
jgi:hypothetical protein